ncbi:aminotransferase DegT/DnrJ/EryC1/StrS family protein [Dissulfurispira thermophila]|uniref:Aminotransferase DegT/DnrJ/EryC1/StrS family protein n=2 Tax=root TaxID=1 RepID=A0A7G1GY64_9BACT|nr:DegT/DnrJ/EryC1/StrS family aminotransferase [Dissulfurispira thermophila]BCB95365.1 aminotransferase DegT/DnrJ/EryC1/StrS family protein [Dissulfurispira thermophila]
MKPMIDLKKQYMEIKDEVLLMVNEVLESSQYILGKRVAELEDHIKKYHGVQDAIAVASGTDALHLSLRALGIGEGDEVITTAFTFFATVEAIMYTGAKPVFVDIEPETYNIDVSLIEKKVTERTKAIIPVHIFGHPVDMEGIMDIAQKYSLKVIEDCAQSFGASFNGKKAGSFGDAGCFSFYPSKNLGACGDGGMIILNDINVAHEVRKLRNHGSKGGYRHECLGYNSRLDEIQAGILLVKLKRIDAYNTKRRENAILYNSLLSDIVTCPVEKDSAYHVYHQYTIRSNKRDIIQQCLKEHGISSVIYYPLPLHLQDALRYLGYKEGDLPITEQVSKEVLSLPIYPELTEEDIRLTSEVIHKCLETIHDA